MADKATVQDIVDELAKVLQGITKANGYRTDLGLHVHTEVSEVGIPSVPRCTVVPLGKKRAGSGDRSPDRGRKLEGAIEFTVPASYANALAEVIAADDDIDRRLAEYHQMPNALPVQFEETVFQDRPEGLPVAIALVTWSTGWRRVEDV